MAASKKPVKKPVSRTKSSPVTVKKSSAAKTAAVRKTPAKVLKPKKQVSSRPASNTAAPVVRGRFLAKVVLISAALVAISLGIMTYDQHRSVSVAIAPGQGVMFLSATGKASKAGDTLQVAVYEASGSEPVNALQSAISYPADRLQVASVTTSANFPQEAATDTATPGLIQLARSIRSQSAPLTGTKLVATVNFKVVKDSDASARLAVIKTRSLLVRSTDNQNILDPTAATPKINVQ